MCGHCRWHCQYINKRLIIELALPSSAGAGEALALEKPLLERAVREPLESGESNNLHKDITTYHNRYVHYTCSIIIGRKKSKFMLAVAIEKTYSTVFFVCCFVTIHLNILIINNIRTILQYKFSFLSKGILSNFKSVSCERFSVLAFLKFKFLFSSKSRMFCRLHGVANLR